MLQPGAESSVLGAVEPLGLVAAVNTKGRVVSVFGMTGFGRAEDNAEWGGWNWETRSVNGKALDVRVHAPPGCEELAQAARSLVKSRFARGSFNCQLQLEVAEPDGGISINTSALTRLARKGRLMAMTHGIAPPSVDGLMSLRGVVVGGSGNVSQLTLVAQQQSAVLETLKRALSDLETGRRREGEALAPVLAERLDHLEKLVLDAEHDAGKQPALVRERFEARIAEIAGEHGAVTPERVMQEAAVMAGKADIREEIDRLKAHVDTARSLLASSDAKGRKLDFLCQELNREANTLCSKSAMLSLTNLGLEMKSVIEQFREQVQNVE